MLFLGRRSAKANFGWRSSRTQGAVSRRSCESARRDWWLTASTWADAKQRSGVFWEDSADESAIGWRKIRQVRTHVKTHSWLRSCLFYQFKISLFQQSWSTFVASSSLNNIVKTKMNSIVGPTILLTHDKNVVQALFRQQPCNSLWDVYVCRKGGCRGTGMEGEREGEREGKKEAGREWQERIWKRKAMTSCNKTFSVNVNSKYLFLFWKLGSAIVFDRKWLRYKMMLRLFKQSRRSWKTNTKDKLAIPKPWNDSKLRI